MGRSRTLLGAVPILLRLPAALVEALDVWANEEGVSRNVLVGRELATAVTKRKKLGADR